jgi:ABC-type nitrate/sulfonate/bicarbonate transport system substrate-binding protein
MELVLIAGSSNRAAALMAGAVDITPLELLDAQRITTEAPDKARVMVRFADDLPDMVFTGIHANRTFAQSNPEAVVDYLRALLAVHQQISESPDRLIHKAAEVLGSDAAELYPLVKTHLAVGSWSTDGHFNEALVNAALRFLEGTGDLAVGLTAEAVADWHYLQEAQTPRE